MTGASGGMKRYMIDCSGIQSPEQFWDAYLAATRPMDSGMFGRNLDAFSDALSGGPGYPGVCELCILNASNLKGLRGGKFLEALQEIADEPGNGAVTITFR